MSDDSIFTLGAMFVSKTSVVKNSAKYRENVRRKKEMHSDCVITIHTHTENFTKTLEVEC